MHRIGLVLLVLVVAHSARTDSALCGTCLQESVVGDTSPGDSYAGGILGHSPGETFLAKDTVIESISVWRLADEWNSVRPMKLWIVGLDSTGVPNPENVILEGRTVTAIGDSTHPTEMAWALDPPVSLPGSGTYAFFIQNICDGFFNLLVDSHDGYGDGFLWITRRSDVSDCHLRTLPHPYGGADLVFKVVFCKAMSTATQSTTWGHLKTIYR